MAQNQAEKINTLENRLTEIAGEVRFNESLLLRSENVLQELVELNADCKARNDVQDERMLRILEELRHNHNDVDNVKLSNAKEFTKLADLISGMDANASKRFDRLESRILALENWRWFILGACGIVILILEKFPLSTLFS